MYNSEYWNLYALQVFFFFLIMGFYLLIFYFFFAWISNKMSNIQNVLQYLQQFYCLVLILWSYFPLPVPSPEIQHKIPLQQPLYSPYSPCYSYY